MTNNAWNSPDLTGNGNVLIGQTGGRPVAAQLSGCGIDVTNGAGSITLDTIATGLDYDKISSSTASSSASISFTGLSSTYHCYVVEITNFAPATDGVEMYLRTSTDNGVSYDSGASDYAWSNYVVDNDGTLKDGGSTGDSKMEIVGRTNDQIGGATNETSDATVWIFNPSSASYTKALCMATYTRTNGDSIWMTCGGQRLSAADVDAIQFLMSSGNIASGEFVLYGLKA